MLFNSSFDASGCFVLPGIVDIHGDAFERIIMPRPTVMFDLALALDDETLKQPWMVRAVDRLCDLFRQTKNIDLECGSLYHATHGLMEYRERRFGRWSYPESDKTPSQRVATRPEGNSKKDSNNAKTDQ